MNCSPWFALYVKPRHEKKVTQMLQGKGYEAFLPTYSHGTKHHKSFDLPLFPGYVFCRFEASNRLPVLTTPGVFSIAGSGLNPEPIREGEMEGLKRMLAANVTPVPWPYMSPGQEVSLELGPLRGVRGVVVDANSGRWLVVSINLLQRSVAVKIEREFLSVRVPSVNTEENKIAPLFQ
jgi:transcriptional antiterminator NusG